MLTTSARHTHTTSLVALPTPIATSKVPPSSTTWAHVVQRPVGVSQRMALPHMTGSPFALKAPTASVGAVELLAGVVDEDDEADGPAAEVAPPAHV